MKIEIIKWLGWVLFAIAILHTCQKENPQLATEIKGEFKTDTIEVQKIVYRYKDKDNSELNKRIEAYKDLIDELNKGFDVAPDTIKKEMYKDATALREFYQPFEDDNIKIENSGLVSGYLQTLETKYTIKPTPKKVNFFLGAGINSNLNYKINFAIQNKRGNILNAGFDNQKIFSVDYFVKF